MKNTYFKLVTTPITKHMYNDIRLDESTIRSEMIDKRGLLRGHIEDVEFNTQESIGAPIIPVKMAAFVCARTGYVLTLDYIQGFEASQNSPQTKADMNKEKQMKEAKLTKKPNSDKNRKGEKIMTDSIITQEILDTHVALIQDAFNDGRISEENFDDIHHEVFNTDYFIIGYYNAKQWLKTHDIDVFDLIEFVQEYEKDNFGETTTKINSESMVNMFSYIVGEYAISSLGCFDFEELAEKMEELNNE